MRKIVGIIGGTGKMGKFFKKFFEKNDCTVIVSSRKTKLTPRQCASKGDIILVSVPIDSTNKVIRQIGSFVKKGSLLIDTTSIKKEPVFTMLKYSRCEVIGMHPVFGPGVSSIKGQIVVLCPARGEKWIGWVTKILEKNHAKVKITTPQKHDEMMSLIQGLNHFTTITTAHAMKSLGISIKESLSYTSPIYRLRMAMIGRILNQDPLLYANIEIMNKKNIRAIQAYVNSAKKLQKIIRNKDTKAFLKYFKEASDFFGNFRKEAEKLSDYLVEQMVKV